MKCKKLENYKKQLKYLINYLNNFFLKNFLSMKKIVSDEDDYCQD